MRKLVYYVACSLDGFIAREDGSLADFVLGGDHFADLLRAFPETIPGHLRVQFGVDASNKEFDDVLMGRRTYEVGLDIGVTNPYPHLNQYVVSRSIVTSPDDNIQLIGENPIEFVQELKTRQGKDIWLCGGGALASDLLPEIDVMILKLNPFIMGSGIPMIGGSASKTNLEMLDKKIYENGFMLLRFSVKH
jgi:dihydrofolate reductase